MVRARLSRSLTNAAVWLDEAAQLFKVAVHEKPNMAGISDRQDPKDDPCYGLGEESLKLSDMPPAILEMQLAGLSKAQRKKKCAWLEKTMLTTHRYRSFRNLGLALSDMGARGEQRWMLVEAAAMLRKAISIEPRTDSTYYDLGVVLRRLDDNSGAIDAYLLSITLECQMSITGYVFDQTDQERRATVRNNLSAALSLVQRDYDSVVWATAALDINPSKKQLRTTILAMPS
jgi:tetratricopeptide (TPR) repeat protein